MNPFQLNLDEESQKKVRKTPMNSENKSFFVHESSYVDANVQIGSGTKIWHFCHIQTGTCIGENCTLGQNVNIGNNVIIGNFVKIQNNVSIYEGVELEDYVFCGPSMVFTNILNPRCEFPQRGAEFYLPTRVKRGASLGANSTILCGHTIGKYAFVAAGAVVTRDVPDYALVVGNPARIHGWMCACGTKLNLDNKNLPQETTNCRKCGNAFLRQGNLVTPIKEK